MSAFFQIRHANMQVRPAALEDKIDDVRGAGVIDTKKRGVISLTWNIFSSLVRMKIELLDANSEQWR